jgi:predicted transcriptional regulator
MSLVVHVPEELARRVEAVAAERGVSAEQVAVEAIEFHRHRRVGHD